MSIKVVCGCGFCTLLPSEWRGKRVKCKCGRTFVVGGLEAIAQPPISPPPATQLPPLATQLPPPAAQLPPPEQELPVAPMAGPEAPALLQTPQVTEYMGLERPAHVADTLHRGMHTSRVRQQALLACMTMLLAVASVSAVVVVLRDHNWSVTAMLGIETPPRPVDSSVDDAEAGKSPNASATNQDPSSADNKGAANAGSAARLANLTELISDDGLLLTGLFGDGTQSLELTQVQQETVTAVVARLHENEEALQGKSLTLEQWYAAWHKLGDELLAVLTDAQRRQLQVILERREMERVHLVEYAARFVPELAVALMPWSVPTAGRSFRVITESSFAAAAQDRCCRPSEPTGMLAILTAPTADGAPSRMTVWDLTRNGPGSSVDLALPTADRTSRLSRDGRHCVFVQQSAGTAPVVEVWSTESGKLVGSQELPGGRDGQYTVHDCVAHRVVALGGQSYWVWDFESGEAREIGFPEARPAASPCLAISADGSHMVVAHPHLIANPPDERCIVEVCIYRLDTGELLGNQVFHKDYARSDIGAIALSQDGRDLALVWDFGPDNPARRLVYMNARNGTILKIVEGLPAADQGYARQHQLADRDLFWLPDNGGCVVNLHSVVDAETGAVLPLELPGKLNAGSGGGAAAAEIVEAVPAGDGRLLLIIADRPANPDQKAAMSTLFIDLPKLGPFQ